MLHAHPQQPRPVKTRCVAILPAVLKLLVASWVLAFALPIAIAQNGRDVEPEEPRWTGLRPRKIFPDSNLTAFESGFVRDVWVLKFHEGTRIRLRNSAFVNDEDPRDREDQRRMARVKLDERSLAAGLRAVNGWLQQFGARVEPHFERGEAELEAWRLDGERRSGRELADLNLYYTCKVNLRVGEAALLTALRALRAIAVVETAFPLPLPQDASITSDLSTAQTYRSRSELGIDDDYVESRPGANGAGVRIIDVEAGWNTDHCDLPEMFFTRGISWAPGHHGTAVLGIMAGLDDGVGVTGICHEASFGISSVSNAVGPYALGSAIDSAAAAIGTGDIVLIEQHLQGPNPQTDCPCNCKQFRFIAVEYFPVYFDAIASATANGVIVVEAAGNGSMNLDDSIYAGRFDRTVRDSGAIIVGARCSGLGGGDGCRTGSRGPTCWTNHGTRVDVSAWGQDVVTTGYGDHGSSGPTVDDFYEDDFGGTSSASPIVVGVVAEIQGYLRARGRSALDPWTMRELLVQTGTAQDPSPKHIGPMPNIRHALHELVRMSAVSGDFNGDGIIDLAIGNPWAEVDGRSGAGKVSVCLSSRSHPSARVSYEISQGSTTVDLADAPEENDWFGFALAAGDFDGDGFDDLAIGVPGEDFSTLGGGGIDNDGRVQVVYGTTAGVGRGLLRQCVLRQSGLGGGPASNVDLPGTSETGDLLGYALACGDVDGDGFDDLAMGAPGECYGTVPRTGTVQLIFGSAGSFSNVNPSTMRFSSVAADNLLARSVHVSDLNADGFAELIVGTPGFDTPTTQDVGRVLVYMANAGGIPGTPLVIGPTELLAKTTQDENGDGSITMADLVLARMGESLTSGRTGGGTWNYLYLGAPGFGDANRIGSGAVLEVLDPENPSLGKLLQQSSSSTVTNLPGTAGRFDLTGTSLACGDFNGDGFDDLAIGAPGEGVTVDSGAVRVVDGVLFFGVSTAAGTASFSETSWPAAIPEFAELFGATVLSLDHNGDGFQDLLVLEPGEDTSAAAPDLSLRFLYGGPPGLRPSTGEWCAIGQIIEPTPAVISFIRADVNEDRSVDVSDAVATLSFLFDGGAAPLCMDAADSNDDGVVDISDPSVTLAVLFLGGALIRPPTGESGVDPTPDNLRCEGGDRRSRRKSNVDGR